MDRTAWHIFLVQKAAVALARCGEFDEDLIDDLLHVVVHHDRSKFGADEWDAYARYWNRLTEQQRTQKAEKTAFMKAWRHHCRHNPHHVDFWPSPDDMALHFVLEMVCDWAAMGFERGTSLSEWAEDFIPKRGIEKHRALVMKAVAVLGDDGTWAKTGSGAVGARETSKAVTKPTKAKTKAAATTKTTTAARKKQPNGQVSKRPEGERASKSSTGAEKAGAPDRAKEAPKSRKKRR